MNLEKVKSELLKIDSRFRIERPDEDTIHICYGTKIFVCALQNKDGKWDFSTDYDDFKECRDFREALNKVDDWWDCTKASVTAPKLTDEEFRRQAFTDDPDVIAKRLADYTNYLA